MVLRVEVRLNEEVEIFSCTFSRDGRQLILYCKDNTLRIYSVSNAQLIKVIQLNGGDGIFSFVGITADGCQVVSVTKHRLRSPGIQSVRLWDIHGDVTKFEDVYVSVDPGRGESVSKIAISPLDNSIAIMTPHGVIKLVHRRARDISWTVEVVADGKCFDKTGKMSFSTSGQLLATVRVDGVVEIWDASKGKCLRMIVCDALSMLKFSPGGSILAAATSLDDRICLYNI
jgi:WD40 repeat protein